MELKLEGIEKYYGKQQVLKDLNLSFKEGVYGLLGPNGAGKTTLISIMMGLLEAHKGRILLNGEETIKMGTRYLDQIGYLPQYPIFYKNFTTKEFLSYMCALKGVKLNRIEEVLALVNLTEAYHKKVGALSGGMRQRLGIAQAILNNPSILVLDEPTAGLDPGERIRFRNIISKLAKDRLVLLATHIVPDVECIAREIVILKEGQVVRQGSPEALAQQIEGKVWEIVVDEDAMTWWTEHYLIGNMKRLEQGFKLKIVSEQRPHERASLVPPTLEDVFLSIFGNSRGS